MKKLSILTFVFIISFTAFSSILFCQNNNSFEISTNRVYKSVVRIFGQATIATVKEHMAESVVNDSNQVFSIGTGFFISNDGLIATAYHVIAPITKDIIVQHNYNNNLSEFVAKLVSFEKDADVALIKIEGSGFPSVTLFDPINSFLGSEIGFIGFPLLSPFSMVNKGVISAKADMPLLIGMQNRHVLVLNAFINKGNSGGPLFLGSTSEVIGVINARKTTDINNLMIKLPANYTAPMSIGGVDPIALSVETYNKNLELIGDVTQFGIGYSASAEYLIALKKEYEQTISDN